MDEKKYKILIIDDDKFLLNMYSAKFKRFGHEVEVLTSAESAIEKIRGGYAPDIIVVDIVMSFMDGLGFLEVIRKENLASKSVIIMLTNQGGIPEIEKAKSMGVHGYIVKATSIPSEVVEMVLKITKDNL